MPVPGASKGGPPSGGGAPPSLESWRTQGDTTTLTPRDQALRDVLADAKALGVDIVTGEEAERYLDHAAKMNGIPPEHMHAVTLGDLFMVREAGATDPDQAPRQARHEAGLRDPSEVVVGFRVEDRDRAGSRRLSQRRVQGPGPVPHGRERDRGAPQTGLRQHRGQRSARVGVVPPPELGLLQRPAFDQNMPVPRGAAGRREGRRQDREGRAVAPAQALEGGGEFRRRLAAQGRVDLLEDRAARMLQPVDEGGVARGRRLRAELAAVGIVRDDVVLRPGFRLAPLHAGRPAAAGEGDGAIGRAGEVVGEDEPASRHGHARFARGGATGSAAGGASSSVRSPKCRAVQAVASGVRIAVTTTVAATSTVAGAAASA